METFALNYEVKLKSNILPIQKKMKYLYEVYGTINPRNRNCFILFHCISMECKVLFQQESLLRNDVAEALSKYQYHYRLRY